MKPYYSDGDSTIYHGDCGEIIPTLKKVDHIITDPPYSARTHARHRGSTGPGNDGVDRKDLGYAALSDTDVEKLSALFMGVCDGWIVWMTDHILARFIDASLSSHGRYVFAPLPFYAPGSRVRLSGDGPSSWTIWIVVSRTAAQSKWGTLPGGYLAEQGWRDRAYMGGKPMRLMTALVGDYSREGETILDPCMGSGTTLEAAKFMGRKGVGIDISEAACEQAARRLSQGVLV